MRKLSRSASVSRTRHRLRWMLLSVSIAATAALTSGCATPPKPEGTAEQICRSWKEIGIRKADKLTTETAREIVANNESRPEWCGRFAEARK